MSALPPYPVKKRAAHIGAPCGYCTARMSGRTQMHWRSPTVDHVVPRSLGGTRALSFIVCRACNADKGALTLAAWHAELEACSDIRAAVVRERLADVAWTHARANAPFPSPETERTAPCSPPS